MTDEANFKVFSDGGSRGNPGQAAYGFVIYDHEENVVYQEGKRIGIATNNVAEYMGVLKALEYLSKNTQKEVGSIACFMDSMLVAQQLSGNWKIKNEHLRDLYYSVKNIEDLFPHVTYTAIRREHNKKADSLVNQALDAEDM